MNCHGKHTFQEIKGLEFDWRKYTIITLICKKCGKKKLKQR